MLWRQRFILIKSRTKKGKELSAFFQPFNDDIIDELRPISIGF